MNMNYYLLEIVTLIIYQIYVKKIILLFSLKYKIIIIFIMDAIINWLKNLLLRLKRSQNMKFNKKKFRYSKNPIELNDINQKYDLCFCYNLLG